jgi:hypothetical protein
LALFSYLDNVLHWLYLATWTMSCIGFILLPGQCPALALITYLDNVLHWTISVGQLELSSCYVPVLVPETRKFSKLLYCKKDLGALLFLKDREVRRRSHEFMKDEK